VCTRLEQPGEPGRSCSCQWMLTQAAALAAPLEHSHQNAAVELHGCLGNEQRCAERVSARHTRSAPYAGWL
jgi:hypothetical protein